MAASCSAGGTRAAAAEEVEAVYIRTFGGASQRVDLPPLLSPQFTQ